MYKKSISKTEDNQKLKGWAAALADAEVKLASARREMWSWKAVVDNCKEMLEKGEPWPSKKETVHRSLDK